MIVTFGEVMGRLSPPGFLRLRQSAPGDLRMTFAGAEANVAATIAALGGKARFLTALPDNDLGHACVAELRKLGVDTGEVAFTARGRLGLLFLEAGINQRPGRVLYDREGSSFAMMPAQSYEWDRVLAGATWLHVSGISPAVSREASLATLAAVKAAKGAGVMVSCDLNFRQTLWTWEEGSIPRELARRTMQELVAWVDVVLGNEEDCEAVLGVRGAGSDLSAGRLEIARFEDVGREVLARFPNLRKIGITLRESVSASHNRWGAMLLSADSDRCLFAPVDGRDYAPYAITDIVDRVGAGDAFAGALIFAQHTPELQSDDMTLRFAVAVSCLAHSISGDFKIIRRREAEALMNGGTSGRIQR